jgi:hypothetical protein
MNTNNNTPKYKIEVADRTGHSTFADLTLDEATNQIIENAADKARWVFINGEKFEFTGADFKSKANVEKLQTALQQMDDPAVLLTGRLVGGVLLSPEIMKNEAGVDAGFISFLLKLLA